LFVFHFFLAFLLLLLWLLLLLLLLATLLSSGFSWLGLSLSLWLDWTTRHFDVTCSTGYYWQLAHFLEPARKIWHGFAEVRVKGEAERNDEAVKHDNICECKSFAY